MTTHEPLLRPTPASRDSDLWRWRHLDIEAVSSWCERTGREPEQWTMWAREWAGPEKPQRDLPVVIVHGMGIGSMMCAPLGDRLAVDGPVFAPDLPGVAKSDIVHPGLEVRDLAESLIAWLDARGIEKCVLVGTSLGATLAMTVAVERPELCAAVIAASPTVDPERRSWFSLLPRWPKEAGTQTVKLQMTQFRDYGRSLGFTPVKILTSLMEFDTDAVAEDLDVPTLFVVGGNDPLMRTEWGRELANAAPDGDVVILPGVVHAMSHENPVEFARVVNGFIDRAVRHDNPEEGST